MGAREWYKSPRTSKSRAESYAKEILTDEGIHKLSSIKSITREKPYKAGHTGVTKNADSNREEERIVLSIFKQSFDAIGEVLDYQVPLKDSHQDKSVGKIDLIAYNNETQTLTLLELKKPSSTETLLRATLEIYTYWKIINKNKLLLDFKLPLDTSVEKAVFLFKDSYAYKEHVEQKSPSSILLMQRLNVGFYGIVGSNNNYRVFIP